MGRVLSRAVRPGAASAAVLRRVVFHALALGGLCEGRVCGVSGAAPADSVRHLARANESRGQQQVCANSHLRMCHSRQRACSSALKYRRY